MTKKDLINKIWDCYIDSLNSCGKITDEEAMQKSIKLLDEYELSKLRQHTVINAVCENPHCNDGITMELYGEKYYCHVCRDKQTDL